MLAPARDRSAPTDPTRLSASRARTEKFSARSLRRFLSSSPTQLVSLVIAIFVYCPTTGAVTGTTVAAGGSSPPISSLNGG
jgi:hypothetical protein